MVELMACRLLLSIRHQTITRINDGLFSIGCPGNKLSEIQIKIRIIFIKEKVFANAVCKKTALLHMLRHYSVIYMSVMAYQITSNSTVCLKIVYGDDKHQNSTLLAFCEWKQMVSNAETLRWRHNGIDGVSNHQPHHCLLNRLFGCRSKKTSKLRVTGLCAGNSPGTGEFPAQMASNAENVSIWWRHHEAFPCHDVPICCLHPPGGQSPASHSRLTLSGWSPQSPGPSKRDKGTHSRCRCWKPRPQVFEHSLQLPHGAQSPGLPISCEKE